MSQPAQSVAPPIRPEAQLRPASWFLRRLAICILALFVFIVGGGALLDAGIESDGRDVAGQSQTDSE